MNIDYIVANPTGNITVLVTSNVSDAERHEVVQEMFREVPACEQVGFVVPLSESRIKLDMMGGEFCGNATISAAAYLASLNKLTVGGVTTILVDASGVNEAVSVVIECKAPASYSGTIEMPMPSIDNSGKYSVVHMDGISHMIIDDDIDDEEMMSSIRKHASDLNVPALGMLKYTELDGDTADVEIRPLVYVAGSNTLVWENGCASGSIAAAYYRFVRTSAEHTVVRQPGGLITIDFTKDKVLMTGNVTFQGNALGTI